MSNLLCRLTCRPIPSIEEKIFCQSPLFPTGDKCDGNNKTAQQLRFQSHNCWNDSPTYGLKIAALKHCSWDTQKRLFQHSETTSNGQVWCNKSLPSLGTLQVEGGIVRILTVLGFLRSDFNDSCQFPTVLILPTTMVTTLVFYRVYDSRCIDFQVVLEGLQQ